jgi:hypothetical protein
MHAPSEPNNLYEAGNALALNLFKDLEMMRCLLHRLEAL